LSEDQHPVTAQVVELLGQPRSLAEVLDLAPANDLDVLVVLSTLMKKGVARVAENEAEGPGRGPLLGPAEVHALRTRVFRGRPPTRAAVAKVFVVGQPGAARKVLTGLNGLSPVAAAPEALRSGFGTLGGYALADSLRIDFCCLPPADAARPLWRPFCAGAVGALVMDGSEAAVKLGTYLGWEIRVPLIAVGHEVPAALHGAPAGAAAVGGDLLEALRALLVQSLSL
jgi:hypothetical protein